MPMLKAAVLAAAILLQGPAAKADDCIDTDLVLAAIPRTDTYSNPRRVPDDKVGQAVFLYYLNASEEPRWWPLVYLVDKKDGSGLIFVGQGGTLCEYRPFAVPQWRMVIYHLEGLRS